MLVLVTGAAGQLGSDVLDLLKARGISSVGVDKAQLDVTDSFAVEALVSKIKPSHVIHCAAYTAVDKAEKERELCQNVNVNGAENVARACAAAGAVMLYISTDYVYGGSGEEPFTEDSPVAPLNWYGQTKLNGENAVQKHVEKYFIVRTSWVFGKNGSNFVNTMLRLSKENQPLCVVCDQVGSPTYTRDLAVVLAEMIFSDAYGIYHVTNGGFCSWYEFACTIFRLAGIPVQVRPVPTAEYKTAAKRPLNSRLSKAKLKESPFRALYGWKDALQRYLEEIGELKQ